MDGFPEPVLQTFCGKSNKKKGKKDAGNKSKAGSSKVDEESLKSIGKATGEDVCCCIRVLAEYIKEVIKLICCEQPSGKCDTKFMPLFCELGGVTIKLCTDMYYLIKYLLKCVMCAVDSKSGRRRK